MHFSTALTNALQIEMRFERNVTLVGVNAKRGYLRDIYRSKKLKFEV